MRTGILVLFIAAVVVTSDTMQERLATNTALLKIGAKDPRFALGYRAGYVAGAIASVKAAA